MKLATVGRKHRGAAENREIKEVRVWLIVFSFIRSNVSVPCYDLGQGIVDGVRASNAHECPAQLINEEIAVTYIDV